MHHEGMGSGERSPSVVARHEFSFADGAQRFYCELRELSRLDPRRGIAWLALYGRATVLAAATLLRLRGREPDTGPELDRSVRDAYARLVQMLMRGGDGPQVVMLTSAETGEGVTSTVAALGQELALRGNAATLLVDANPDEAKLHRVFWMATSAGLAEALADPALDVTELVQRVADQLSLLPHGEAPYNLMSPGGRERLRACMARLAEGRRFVLVDAPALDRRADALSLASQVDAVILVVRAETVEQGRIAEATGSARPGETSSGPSSTPGPATSPRRSTGGYSAWRIREPAAMRSPAAPSPPR
jgi:Mrp family chromosome partitioning ATPase